MQEWDSLQVFIAGRKHGIFPFLVSVINSNLTELAKYVAQLPDFKAKVQHVDDFEISE